jgi:hypothetical protein
MDLNMSEVAMHDSRWASIDVEFYRTDGLGISGKRHEKFDAIPREDLNKYGDDAEKIGWAMLSDRFLMDKETVKDNFVLLSVNIEIQ